MMKVFLLVNYRDFIELPVKNGKSQVLPLLLFQDWSTNWHSSEFIMTVD